MRLTTSGGPTTARCRPTSRSVCRIRGWATRLSPWRIRGRTKSITSPVTGSATRSCLTTTTTNSAHPRYRRPAVPYAIGRLGVTLREVDDARGLAHQRLDVISHHQPPLGLPPGCVGLRFRHGVFHL